MSLEQGKRAVGIKNVTINEPYFMGHFPDNPVMPGVLRGTKGGPQPDADAPLASAIRGDHYDMTPRRVWHSSMTAPTNSLGVKTVARTVGS